MVQNIRQPPNKPIDELRPVKVVCIGAGFSGILTAIRFPQRLHNLELTIYEKNADIGGTWFENRYPGIACDIPAHVYQFSFANNPNWSRFYAPGGEIQEYLKDVAHKYDVEKYCRFRHFFEKGDWNEESHKWDLQFKNLATGETVTDTCDVLLKGTGILNNWRWPEIDGLHTFKGDLMHSAQWDPTFDVTGKTVALIGAGSSGIQILPQIQPKAKHIYHYMKGKTWISPFGYGAEGGDAQGPVEHSLEERQRWSENPAEYQAYRHKVEALMNASQLVTFRGTEIAAGFWEASKQSHKEKLAKKPYINDLLTPTYPPGCRRLTPGPGYLESLVEDNVDYIGTGITKVTENGILDQNGDFHEVDAILCATGFDYSMTTDPPITGRDGMTLAKMWSDRPEAYMSMCVPNMPNMFIYLGPNGGPGAGSFIAMLESVAEYIIKCVQKLQLEYIGAMDAKPLALKAFTEHVDQYFDGTIFTYHCKSWFKRNQEDGKVVALWPGSSLNAQTAFKHPRYEDFNYTYLPQTKVNPLCWFGNGLTVAQETGKGTTAYLDAIDIPPIINKEPRKKEVVVQVKQQATNYDDKAVAEHVEGKLTEVVVGVNPMPA